MKSWFLPLAALLLQLGAQASLADVPGPERLLDSYCSRCHNDEDLSAGLSFAGFRASDVPAGANIADWEKILRRTRTGEMPPKDKPQPTAEALWMGITSLMPPAPLLRTWHLGVPCPDAPCAASR